jgi:YHS domain-containing protein
MMTRRTILQGLVLSALAGSGLVGASLVEANLAGAGRVLAQNSLPLALKGYDPVAYFTDGKPREGVAQYELLFDGQRYRFASAQHRDLFKANPDKYAPQFGGLCAMNLSRGVRRESDPHNWIISNGNLYVFAGETGRQSFANDANATAARAATQWKTLKTATQ